MNLSILVQRIVAGCVAALSFLALFLATVGMFAMISYSVTERKKELGIRAALGARPSQLLRLILQQISAVAGAGIALGTILGIAVTAVFRPQFYGVQLLEWFVLLPVAAAMMAIVLLTASCSAWPSTKVNPMDVVRHT
jgi:ABC-type antimicrobial peptide transport system permease subunit